MRGGIAVLAAVLVLVSLAGVAAAGPPIVSAGLDQDVVRGDTVYLDAGGTHVPDGELAELEWTIEAPNGSAITPECVDCSATRFQPEQLGQYAATVTARSESGHERSDTLFVTVNPPDTQVSNGTASGGGSDGNGCFVSFEGDDGEPMDTQVCDEVGAVVDVTINEQGTAITHYVLDTDGFLLEYEGVEILDNGYIRVPTQSFNHQTVDLYEWLYEDGDYPDHLPPSNRDGLPDYLYSDDDSGGENEGTRERIEENEEMDLDSCKNVPSSYC